MTVVIPRGADPVLEATVPMAGASASPEASTIATSAVAIPVAKTIPAHPGARREPTAAEGPLPGIAALALPPDFLEQIADLAAQRVAFTLPDGRQAEGSIELQRRDGDGLLLVQGRLSAPGPGFYFFTRETLPGVAGALGGSVRFDGSEVAYRIDPTGKDGTPMLVAHQLDQVICRNFPAPAPDPADSPAPTDRNLNAPPSHPTDIAFPEYQEGIVPLQSLPGAAAVIYIDFDGEKGPLVGWGNYDAEAPPGVGNERIKEIWQRVAEDYQGFNINVTTDRLVFDKAPLNSRQHVLISTTTTAAPNNGGVAQFYSFNSTYDIVCWVFYTNYQTNQRLADVVSHEVGHTLGLSHDGQNPPGGAQVVYYAGQGSGETAWAPIMGAGDRQILSQWSKGEYANPSNTEDDLAIITNNNNSLDYRADDYGPVLATAGYLEILPDNSVSNGGILEERTDVDAFRFVTSGGAVSLTASGVNQGADVDLLAEIYDSSNNLVASANPANALNATVSANLGAGEYTLRVSGVGLGDPLVDGYSDYASNGAYLITGTVAGGVKPDRFSVVENSANGTPVGNVNPRGSHGANPLSFAIASGNAGGAFAINPTSGAITVANPGQLDFETLSTQWDDPATIQLFVAITDSVNPAKNESIRVVVSVTSVNEAPILTGGAVTILEHTAVGTAVFQVSGSDPDHFDFPRFSIVAGNTGGAFALDAESGQITVAADLEASLVSTYNLSIRATDQAVPAATATSVVTIQVLNIPNGYSAGSIVRTYFGNIGGTTLDTLTNNSNFPGNPDTEEYLTSFDGIQHGDNYGSMVRGYLIPPVSGSYTFWISTDDYGELRIGTDANPAGATVRAAVNGYSDRFQWTKYPAQQSAPITLTAGTPYYIEARQKEAGGGDHVQVAWQGPGITQQIIPGAHLAPYRQNYAPQIPAATFKVREGTYGGAMIGTVTVKDANPSDGHSFSITGGTGAAAFNLAPTTGKLSVKTGTVLNAATTPSYTLTVSAIDSGSPALTGTATLTVNVVNASAVTVNGIVQEIWEDINGNNLAPFLSDPRYPDWPNNTRTLAAFDTVTYYSDFYGSRIRAYVIPPVSGAYTFYIASDDEGRLLLSNSSDPAGATPIANVPTYSARNEFTKFPAQTSAPVNLVAGQRYYIEALYKDGCCDDFVQVAWTGPGIASRTIIPGSALQAFDINLPPMFGHGSYSFTTKTTAPNGTVVGTVAASDPTGDGLTYAILGGNIFGAFGIDPQSGAISVIKSTGLHGGLTVTLQIGVQDDGTGGLYSLKTDTATATISIVDPPPIEQWTLAKFGANPAPGTAGYLDNPDHDAWVNLLEYALGLNPLLPDSGGLIADLETIGADKFLRLTVTKNPTAFDIQPIVEVSGDLSAPVPWTSAGTTVEIDNPTTLQVRDNTPVSAAAQRFIRLKVPPP